MEFGVLGPLEAVAGDHRYSLGGPKQRAVLALLVAYAGSPVATGTLIDSVYGGEAPDRASRSIHTFVSNLRSDLGEVIERVGDGYAFVAGRATVDAYRFEEAIAVAETMDDPAESSVVLRDALALWRGLPYADVDVYDSLAAEITRLNELRVTAIGSRIDAELADGRHAVVIAELESLVVDHPLRESFWAQHMLALYRSGRQAEALRAFNKARTQLAEETGLEPSPELADLERRIFEHDASLQYEARPEMRKAVILAADVADSTKLTSVAPVDRDRLVERQTRAVNGAVKERGGNVFGHRGSAMYAVFDAVHDAAAAAVEAQSQLIGEAVQMRMALSFGDVEIRPGGEALGPPVNRAAALVGAAHGGQILLAAAAHQALADADSTGWVVRSLGTHSFGGMSEPIGVYQLVVSGLPESFPPLRMSELPPPVPRIEMGLPGYELREEVGSGVYGTVHRAYQPSVGREVAIKIIRPEYANHPEFIRRFEVEAQLVARLEHPHIVPLHDYWREPGGAFLVMRWLRGGTLNERLDRGPLVASEVDSLLGQLGTALDHAHRQGIVHRDLKSSNVLFDEDGNAYLTDFGVAKRIDDAAPASISGDVCDLARLMAQCLSGATLSEEIERFLSESVESKFGSLRGLLDAWGAVAGASTPVADEVSYTSTRNPYKGLHAFAELDVGDFHGRTDEVQQLVAAVASQSMVAVVGPSGIGKSSLVRAGLLPALRDGALSGSAEWLISDFLPGRYPFEALASALLRVAAEPAIDVEDELRRDRLGLVRAAGRHLPDGAVLLLVIDQFEELFTLVDNDDQKLAFLQLLRAAVTDQGSSIRIVLTIRADLFDQPLRFGDFGDLLRVSTVPVTAPSEVALREIIEKPAAGVGVGFEPGLIDRIIGDVKDQPGALPLLEFSLTELFAARDKDELSLKAYDDSGGVLGALGRRAEVIYEGLDRAGRDAVRQALMRLVHVAESGGATRRRVRLRELEQLNIDSVVLRSLMEVFGVHRLLTFDRDPVTRGPTVEVAHEAILTHWPRLVKWIVALREDLILHSRLAVAVSEWETSGRSDEYLLNPGRLSQHETWLASTDLSLTSAEAEFIRLSRAEDDRQRTQARRDRSRVMAVFAATQAIAQLEIDSEQSLLLALEAADIADSADLDILEVTTAVRRALSEHRIVNRTNGGVFVAVSPDGQSFAGPSAAGGVIVRNLDDESIVTVLERPGALATGAEFSPVGGKIAITYATSETPLWLWDLGSKTSRQFDGPGITPNLPPHTISFDETGDLVATLLVDGVHVWSTTSGLRRNLIDLDDAVPQFITGTSHILLADWSGSSLRTFDVDTAELTTSVTVPGRPTFMAVSADGQIAVVAYQNENTVVAHEVESGKEVWRTTVDRPGSVAWLSDGGRLAIGGEAGQISLLEIATGEVIDVLRGGHSSVWSLASVPGRDLLVTSGRQDGTTLLWDVQPGSRPEIGRLESGLKYPHWVTFAPYPEQVFVVDRANPATGRIFNTTTMETVIDLASLSMRGLANTRIIGDGSLLAVSTTDGASTVLDVTTGATWYSAPEGQLVLAASHDGALVVVAPHPDAGPSTEQPQIVDLETGRVIACLDIGAGLFPFFSYNDRLIFDFAGQEVVSLFDVRTGEAVLRLPEVMSVRPMPDGKMVSVVEDGGQVWHANLGALISGQSIEEASEWSAFATRSVVIPRGHIANSDGSLVAIMGRGSKPAKIWDTATGRQVASLDPGLTSGNPQVFFHPEEPYVTLLGDGGVLLTYTLDTDELVAIARNRVTRTLTEAERSSFLHL